MKLWQRILAAQAVMLTALVLVIVAGQQQVTALHDDVAQAREEYEELQLLAAAQAALIEARTRFDHQQPVDRATRSLLASARASLRSFLDLQHTHTTERPHQRRERLLSGRAVERIDRIVARADAGETDAAADIALLRASLEDVRTLSDQMDRVVADAHDRAAARVRRADWWLVAAPLAGLLLAAGAGVWQYVSVVRPVQRLRRGAAAVAGGDLSARVDQSGRDEVAELAADFNRMADELESLYRGLDEQVRVKSRELAHAERLSSVGFLAAGFAHEINNPLSIIHGYAEEAQRDGADGRGDPAAALGVILEESRRCRDIVGRLLALASPGQPARSRVDLDRIVGSVVELVRGLPQYRRRTIDHAPAPTPMVVTANPDEIKQVLLNLMINALEATDPDTGRVTAVCERRDDRVAVEVRDNGSGMDGPTLAHVFDPFFSTRRPTGRTGAGLGLSISHAIVQQHGGSLTAGSDGPGRGSRFRVDLPAADATEPADG